MTFLGHGDQARADDQLDRAERDFEQRQRYAQHSYERGRERADQEVELVEFASERVRRRYREGRW